MNKFVIMLEEDSDDRYLTQEVLSDLNIDIPVKFFSNSIDFFSFLSVSDKPALILVDYNSNPDNGIEVLKKIKTATAYNDIPVVILSDSDHPRYRNECYRHGASSFIKKPDTVEATNKKIASFFNYWFDVVEI
jgi:CheY-like chemotaxis protein